jgi:2,3-bisphosphoglycerate-independent phosphoglycerate mutase
MLEPDGVSPHTAHTTSPVPFVVTDPTFTTHERGELSGLAPTILGMLGLATPAEMTGAPIATSA